MHRFRFYFHVHFCVHRLEIRFTLVNLRYVSFQIGSLAEHSWTKVAEQILLTLVNEQLVSLQGGLRVDDSFANSTLHSLLVVPALAFNDFIFARRLRRLALDRLCRWLEVNFSVPHQLRFLSEALLTEIARPASLFLVDCQDVPVEAGLFAESFVAEVAGVPSHLLVDHLDV